MKFIHTAIHGVLIIKPIVFNDGRGLFFESWNQKSFTEIVGEELNFVQDNHSHSKKGVLRGLHYQIKQPQGKLVRVVTGNVLDVVVDIRKSSPTFGKHITLNLIANEHKELWIPAGCAHGFVVLSEAADLLYKTTDYYTPEYEKSIRYDDPELGIDWQLHDIKPQLSKKDKNGLPFKATEYFP